ncbi:MAG: hypothetical protein J6386_21045 [Candidatus Synoicihabitans palmerolidicus]|nr:hypothetical protein [Candidatus Synoicihabitans palmerolidicus]
MDNAALQALRSHTAALARGDDAAWQRFHPTQGTTLLRYLIVAARGDTHLARRGPAANLSKNRL